MSVLPVSVTRDGALMPRSAWLLLVALVSLTLVMSSLSIVAAADEPKSDKEPAKVEKVLERPDRVSAMATARVQDGRVQVTGETSATEEVFANPDGTWTVESYADPVRVRQDSGVWQQIDTTLVEAGDGWVPRVAATGMVFSAGGDGPFVTMRDLRGKDLSWGWPTDLPEPVVGGNTLTYADVVEGGDLVVTALPTGFSHSIVLDRAPVVAEGEAFTVPIPVDLDGAKIAEGSGGSLQVSAGMKALVVGPAPVMFDASEDAAGEPEQVAAVGASVETIEGQTNLVLTPDADMLADPDTVYPVTIDPSYVVSSPGSVWVQSTGTATSAQLSNPELRVGTYDSGTHKARSFVKFNSGSWAGKEIASATLRLRNFSSYTCSAAEWP